MLDTGVFVHVKAQHTNIKRWGSFKVILIIPVSGWLCCYIANVFLRRDAFAIGQVLSPNLTLGVLDQFC